MRLIKKISAQEIIAAKAKTFLAIAHANKKGFKNLIP
jgi:hypothetical protein